MGFYYNYETGSEMDFEDEIGPGSIYLGPIRTQKRPIFTIRFISRARRFSQAMTRNPKVIRRIFVFSWVLVAIAVIAVG
jgi:hypothetical protein